MQQYTARETETQAKSQDKQSGLSAASKYLSAAADTISKAAVGGGEASLCMLHSAAPLLLL